MPYLLPSRLCYLSKMVELFGFQLRSTKSWPPGSTLGGRSYLLPFITHKNGHLGTGGLFLFVRLSKNFAFQPIWTHQNNLEGFIRKKERSQEVRSRVSTGWDDWVNQLHPAAEICVAVNVGLVHLHLYGNRLIAQPFVICVTVYLITIHGHKWLHLIRECALSDIHIPTR